MGTNTGGLATCNRMTVTMPVALSGGWPLSVTMTLMWLVVPPRDGLVAQVIWPLDGFTTTPAGAPAPRLKVRVLSGLGSLAVTLSVRVCPALSVTLEATEMVGGVVFTT